MKRIRPAPMGRAYHYVRRISHLEIVLGEKNRNGVPVGTSSVTGEKAAKAAPHTKAKAKAKAPAKQKTAGKTATAKKDTGAGRLDGLAGQRRDTTDYRPATERE